ncbi:MAG: hypothetical protein ACFFAN_13785 [Promethearchaeota archaeon]
MNIILVWISTVGWSTYAVINPLWAYCKYKREFPQKVILIHTDHKKIKENVEFCRNKINKILKIYSDDIDFEPIIEDYLIESEHVDVFSNHLEKIIDNIGNKDFKQEAEISKFIILDMTPGRKYMSAKIMNIGDKKSSKNIPIQVYYLHLEDMNYLNYPYSMIPAINHDLIDILEEKNVESGSELSGEIVNAEDFSNKLNIIFKKSLFKNIKKEGKKRDFISYSAIYKGYNKIPLISRFSQESGYFIQHRELNNVLRLGLLNNHIHKDRDFENPRIDFYCLSEDGLEYLKKIIEEILEERPIKELEIEQLKEFKLIHEIKEVQKLKFSMNEKSRYKKYVNLSSNELILLLNELYLNNFRKFKIIDCLYGFNLSEIIFSEENGKVNINLGDLLNNFPSNEEKKKQFFQERLKGRLTKEERKAFEDNPYAFLYDNKTFFGIRKEFFEEIPNKSEFKNIIRKIGLFFKDDYVNNFKPILRDFINWNPMSNDPPIVFAFDTSTYMNQTYTNLLMNIKNDDVLKRRITKLDFFVSKGVRNELKMFEDLYDQRQYRDYQNYFKKVAIYPNIVNEFWRQSTLKVRNRFLGHEDFTKCLETTNYKLIDEGISEDPDLRILIGLDNEISKNLKNLYIFTHDEKFLTRTTGGFTLFKCQRLFNAKIDDNTFSEFSCDWRDLISYIYFLSIIFGAIIINLNEEINLVLFGIWRGKSTEDWNKSRVRLYTSNSILSGISKDLKILRNE